ncbi:MAG: ABC transporter permease, partial [Dongia sp.]
MMHSRAISRALFAFAMLYLAFLYIPVLLLPLFSFNDNVYVAFPLKGFTFKWYRSLAANQPLVDAFLASVKVGLVVSAVSTVLGMLAAMAMTR